ncbi:2-oxo acid dehydrogenase subunit E2 [Streptomyces sp. NPDC088387]|uniref:2-oxo acid dehydrogenase subunit E2 n=1 Tax=Streptomyces sp. NPDC088387 TaxID=3365859 RepID=UPI0037FA660A
MSSPDEVILVPHPTVRRRAARHLLAASNGVAHAHALVDVDYGAVDAVRGRRGPAWREEHGHGLGCLPFVARAVLLAVEAYPRLTARFTDEGLELRRTVGLGIAVDLDFEGLVVPVIQDAGRAGVPELARSIHTLAARARSGQLTGADVSGGTFTLSNPGPFGARQTLPIVNAPQVAIITVDAVAPRPVAVPDGRGGHTVVVRPVGNLTLAWDHRAFDGAYAARALGAVREALETHAWDAEFPVAPGPHTTARPNGHRRSEHR